jgi:hypothetical protein
MAREKARKPRQPKLESSVEIRLDPTFRPTAVAVGVLRDPSTSVAVEYPLGLPPADALGLLQSEHNHFTMHRAMLAAAVASARDAGCSWSAIAQVLGVTRQAAHKRYAPLIGEVADA